MPEPTDAIMPILQRIQADVADMKRDMSEIKQTLNDHTVRLRDMNGFLSFNLNVVSRHNSEIDVLRDELNALKHRVAKLESA